MFGDAALLLIAICVVAYVVTSRYQKRRRVTKRYELEERTVPFRGGSAKQLMAVKGQDRIELGDPIPIRRPTFEMDIEEARADAVTKLAALNSR